MKRNNIEKPDGLPTWFEKYICDQYNDKNREVSDIATELETYPAKIYRILTKYKIPKRRLPQRDYSKPFVTPSNSYLKFIQYEEKRSNGRLCRVRCEYPLPDGTLCGKELVISASRVAAGDSLSCKRCGDLRRRRDFTIPPTAHPTSYSEFIEYVRVDSEVETMARVRCKYPLPDGQPCGKIRIIYVYSLENDPELKCQDFSLRIRSRDLTIDPQPVPGSCLQFVRWNGRDKEFGHLLVWVRCTAVIDGKECNREFSLSAYAFENGPTKKCKFCCHKKPTKDLAPSSRRRYGIATQEDREIDRKLELEREHKNKSNIQGRAHWLLRTVKKRSNKKTKLLNIPNDCDLNEEWFVERLKRGVCEVTGIPFDLSCNPNHKVDLAPSPDQIIPGRGYTQENTKLVIWAYNRFKSEMSENDAISLLKQMHEGLAYKMCDRSDASA